MAGQRGRKLTRKFFDRDTLVVARELIGKLLVWRTQLGERVARIVEVEAYVGQNDPASHSAPGPTNRNRVMFGPPGHAYVYLIYGMYHCLNFVTESEGTGAAVLIRAAEPIEGIELMRRTSPRLSDRELLSGPGKLCRAFELTTVHTGLDLINSDLELRDAGESQARIGKSRRIGISKGIEKEWRFFDPASKSLSRKPGAVIA